MAYRFGELRFVDSKVGQLRVKGDGYAAAGELVTLIVSPDVHRLLGMSDYEVARASEIDQRYREALGRIYSGGAWRPPHVDPAALPARQEVEREVERLLGAARSRRLHRMSWQIRGGDALLDEDVADILRLTAEQRRQVAKAAEDNERENVRVLAEVHAVRGREVDRTSDSSGLQDRAMGANEAGHVRLLALLTPEQLERFTRLGEGER